MSYVNGFRQFRKVFFKPRVFVFILTGIGFLFLTFLTDNNALELGIAGIGSIFIGIGVNNFTAIETQQADKTKLNRKTQYAIKTLLHVQAKLEKLKTLALGNPQMIRAEIEEMCDYIELSIQYLEGK